MHATDRVTFRYLTAEETQALIEGKWICSTCQDPLVGEEGQLLKVVTHDPGKHVMHRDCEIQWLKQDGHCSICRKEADWSQIASGVDRIVYSSAVLESARAAKNAADIFHSSLGAKISAYGCLYISAGIQTTNPISSIIGNLCHLFGLRMTHKEFTERVRPILEQRETLQEDLELLREIEEVPIRQLKELETELNKVELELSENRRAHLVCLITQVTLLGLGLLATYSQTNEFFEGP